MNLNFVQQMVGRFSPRTKMIAVGVIAFLLGLMLTGRGGDSANGRYVPYRSQDIDGVLDTRSGQIWVVNPETHTFKRWASLPYF